jgi:hypothetical protein
LVLKVTVGIADESGAETVQVDATNKKPADKVPVLHLNVSKAVGEKKDSGTRKGSSLSRTVPAGEPAIRRES